MLFDKLIGLSVVMSKKLALCCKVLAQNQELGLCSEIQLWQTEMAHCIERSKNLKHGAKGIFHQWPPLSITASKD